MTARVYCSKCEKEINCAIWEHPCFKRPWWEPWKEALDSTMLKACDWFFGSKG